MTGGNGDTPGETPDDAQLDVFRVDAHAVNVRDLMARTVADLYSHLVTRPTGRAVRLAIESQLEEMERPALSLVDFSSVSILDFSCADEVVAKLLLSLRDGGVGGNAWVLFQGIRDFHRDPIEAVLDRHRIQAVLQGSGGGAELLGPVHPMDLELWIRVEEAGRIARTDVTGGLLRSADDEARLGQLLRNRLVFRHPLKGDILALSALSRELAPVSPPAVAPPSDATDSSGEPS
ncbi:MAG: hypothetical protein EA350_13825 [Gemmatimonadales bacterium]|nr:MAG: hypothetical protein EA350_13825 [Gemmatimonadales bacterium]